MRLTLLSDGLSAYIRLGTSDIPDIEEVTDHKEKESRPTTHYATTEWSRQRLRLGFLLLASFLLLLPLFRSLAKHRAARAPTPFLYTLPIVPTIRRPFIPTPERQIPPYLHYVFGLSENFGGKPFGFIQYITFSSALFTLKPEIIFIHYLFPPTGWWWDQWKKEVDETSRTELVMVKERNVTEVYGNPVFHFAHKVGWCCHSMFSIWDCVWS